MESEDTSYISSRPSNKSINDNSSLSVCVCVCGCEGAQTCLFEQYDSELAELGY